MAIMRWDPFGEFLGLSREMDRMLAGMPSPRLTTPSETAPLVTPRVDVFKRGDDLVIHAEMPGLSADEIDVSVEDRILSISAEHTAEREVNDEDYLMREVSWGSFRRSIPLPEGVDPTALKADYHDGVLEIVAPQATLPHARTVKVPIGAASAEATLPEGEQAETPAPPVHHVTSGHEKQPDATAHH